MNTEAPGDAQLLVRTLQKTRRRSQLESSVLNFESDRSIQQIVPLAPTWETGDPFLESVAWNSSLGGLRGRFQDTLHSLFKKVRNRREAIMQRIDELMLRSKVEGTQTPTNLFELLEKENPDPAIPFHRAFSQLLAPKELLSPDPKNQELFYSKEGGRYPISSLSSGEREVINIVFDFLLRSPNDCIVIFDEPELHLHPELSFKLLQALRAAGKNNQFVFCTHSPDIISASLDNTVVMLTPPKADGSNQAVLVREDDQTNQALRLLGQSIGIVALGKRIVLIEGTDSSLDKQTYGAILKGRFPNFVLVPAGGKGTITSFGTLQKQVLERTIWGVEFFMLCDGDTAPTATVETNRLRSLSRYHLENYFLDETVIAGIFEGMEPADSWLRSPQKIRADLRETARSLIPYATALRTAARYRQLVGNLDIMPKDCGGKSPLELSQMLADRADSERARIEGVLGRNEIVESVKELAASLQASIDRDDEDWKKLIPGKPLLGMFCSHAKLDLGRFKISFIKQTKQTNPFQEIVDIFESFAHM